MMFRSRASRWFGRAWYNVRKEVGHPKLVVTEAFASSQHPKKVNLALDVYRDDLGLPWRLPSILAAEDRLFA
jgi:aspartate/tyrosine/aromatic aminotransferase